MATKTTALTNDEYRSTNAISKSDLDLIDKSISLLEWSRNAPRDQNDTADTGNALHCSLLEPERFKSEYYELPDFDKPAEKRAFIAKMGDKKPADKLIISMRDSVLAHPTARKLLTLEGESEASIFFEVNNVKCKCRPDRIVSDRNFLVDLKTIDDINHIRRSVIERRYFVQDAFYSEGYYQLTGHNPTFIFIFVAKKRSLGTHPVRVLQLVPDDKAYGRDQFMDNIDSYKEYQSFGAPEIDVEWLSMKNYLTR